MRVSLAFKNSFVLFGLFARPGYAARAGVTFVIKNNFYSKHRNA